MTAVVAAAGLLQAVVAPAVLAYAVLHNTWQLVLVAVAAVQVRRRVAGQALGGLELIDGSSFTRPLTLVVPAYNEEVTIVDSVTNLLHCDYPRFEVVVVNDGSRDATLARLEQAFRLRRRDVPYRAAIGTARLRGFYESTAPLPPAVSRLVVIDKENGGKADALNAGINAASAPYFVSMDADSILDPAALKELVQVMRQDPRVVAVGGQVAIANGCRIEGGRVVEVGLPRSAVARFQMVEYLRSFTSGRTGLDRLDLVLILSGVFAVFERDAVIRVGGYLTRFVEHALPREYVGAGRDTVCEDMEIVVRLQRWLRDKRIDRRVAFVPHPVAWTEVPESLESLRKQRGRWHRGLRESLLYHRAMLFNPRFGRIGLVAMPAFWLFEYLGPLVELGGWGYLLGLGGAALATGLPLIDWGFAVWFLIAAMGYGTLVNVAAVLAGAWEFRVGVADRASVTLLPFKRRRDILLLLAYAVLENVGYRQLTLYWRLRGQWDAWRGKAGWEKFARVGLGRQAAAVG